MTYDELRQALADSSRSLTVSELGSPRRWQRYCIRGIYMDPISFSVLLTDIQQHGEHLWDYKTNTFEGVQVYIVRKANGETVRHFYIEKEPLP